MTSTKIVKVLAFITGLYFIVIAGINIYGAPMMVDTFEKIGIGQWFRYVTALCQLIGGMALLWRQSRFYGASLLACVMAGALLVRLTILHNNPLVVILLLSINIFIAWYSCPKKPNLTMEPIL